MDIYSNIIKKNMKYSKLLLNAKYQKFVKFV